jgi:hypothetical protein
MKFFFGYLDLDILQLFILISSRLADENGLLSGRILGNDLFGSQQILKGLHGENLSPGSPS